MAKPTTLTVTYTGGSGSAQTITLPTPDGSNPMDFSLYVRNAFLSGGFWFIINGVETFVPFGQVTSITAQ